MTNLFMHVPKAPVDPILGLTVSFLKDPRKQKVNLVPGIYKTEEGFTPVLSSVKKAEKFLLDNEESKNYLPIDGDPAYLQEVGKLVLGEKLYKEILPSLSLVQSVGGSGALRLGSDFLYQEIKNCECYIPDPTWPNHRAIFMQSGFTVHRYPYYDFNKNCLDFEEMYKFFSSLPPKSVIVLQVSCHNPSGSDLSQEDWAKVADLCISNELIPYFDAAYLGFSGTFEEDSHPIRYFASRGIEFLAAVAFSKNFSMYAERIGFLMVYSKESAAEPILSQLKQIVRRNYSSPPVHGARVIAKILQTPSLKEEWESELLQMKQRINSLRGILVDRLAKAGTKKDYSYFLDKKGLFSFCNLTKNQVDSLTQDHGIYMTSDGRMNIAALNASNIDLVIKALLAVGG